MILQQLHVDGFGKLTNLDLHFSSETNLIYGDNETGKSTLCSFIFHMIYGMERSRGKASHFDAYIRYFPWQSAAYGGSLTFEAEGTTWFLERSFLADNRFLRLTRLEDGVVFSNADTMLLRFLGGVTESAYLAMYLVSQQSCNDITSLSEHLRQYTQNLPGSGSISLSPSQAIKDLKRQKKNLASQILGTSSGDLYRTAEELHEVQQKLQLLPENPASRHDAPHEDDLCDIAVEDDTFCDDPIRDDVLRRKGSTHNARFLPYLLGILLFILSVIFFIYPTLPDFLSNGYTRFLPPVLCSITGLFVMLLITIKKSFNNGKTLQPALEEKDTSAAENFADNSESTANLFAEIYILQNREEALLRQKAEIERILASDEALRQNMSAIQLAIDTIAELSSEIHHAFSPELQRTFARYASALTGRPFSQLLIDESFHFSLMEGNRLVPLEALSRGTITQLLLACRLASIQLLCPNAELPLLLDDIFSLTDDTRLSVLLSRLSMDYPGQKLIFSCQKREASILSHLSLSYHFIQL